jgi:hypothetical protein
MALCLAQGTGQLGQHHILDTRSRVDAQLLGLARGKDLAHIGSDGCPLVQGVGRQFGRSEASGGASR